MRSPRGRRRRREDFGDFRCFEVDGLGGLRFLVVVGVFGAGFLVIRLCGGRFLGVLGG